MQTKNEGEAPSDLANPFLSPFHLCTVEILARQAWPADGGTGSRKRSLGIRHPGR